MDITIYLIFTFIAFILLTIGLLLKKTEEKGIRVAMLMLPFIIFGFLAYTSLNITIPTCANQIMNSTAINTSVTTYSSEISCSTQTYTEPTISLLYSLLALFSLIIAILRAFIDVTEIFNSRR